MRHACEPVMEPLHIYVYRSPFENKFKFPLRCGEMQDQLDQVTSPIHHKRLSLCINTPVLSTKPRVLNLVPYLSPSSFAPLTCPFSLFLTDQLDQAAEAYVEDGAAEDVEGRSIT